MYYKDYDHLLTADSLGHYDDTGSGFSRGIEIFLQKKFGSLTGWVTYSLSESKRREYLDTQEYLFDYDQPHMTTIVLEYHFPKERRFMPDILGLNFRYSTGRPYTPVVGAYQDQAGTWRPIYGQTNSRRYDDFHTLSLRSEWRFNSFRGVKTKVYLEAWNLYDRKNPMGINYELGAQYPGNVKLEPYYSTPLLIVGGL